MPYRVPNEQAAYSTLHSRLQRERGSANQHRCARCLIKQACDWAKIHTEPGHDLWADYVPLCRKCHMIYDGVKSKVGRVSPMKGRVRSAESRELMRQSHLGKVMPDEVKEKIRQANTGRRRSPETRARLSAARRAWWAKKRGEQ